MSCRQLGVESSLLRVSVGLHALLPPGGVRGSDSDPLFRRCGGSLRTAQPPPSVPEVGGSSSGIQSTRTADSGAARGKVGLAIFYTDIVPTTTTVFRGGRYLSSGRLSEVRGRRGARA